MEELIEKYPYTSMDKETVDQYIIKMNKYYNTHIRQKIKYQGKRVDFGSHTVEYERK